MNRFDELAEKVGTRKPSKDKDIRMNIRVEESLRDAFVACCKAQDTTAARELRDHMRKYVKQHGQGKLL